MEGDSVNGFIIVVSGEATITHTIEVTSDNIVAHQNKDLTMVLPITQPVLPMKA